MATRVKPVVGNWYRRSDRPQAFQVVAVDGRAGTIDVEYFDGTVDEWPVTHWHNLEIEAAEPPGDWTGPFDDLEQDDVETDQGQQDTARQLLEGDLREVPPAHWRPNQGRAPRRGKAAAPRRGR